MESNENYKKLAGGIINYIHNLVDIAIEKNLKLIIWGFGRGGKWIKHLINDYDGRIQIEYVIDEKMKISYETKSMIYRSTLLNYLDSGEYLLLSTIRDISQILPLLSSYGYELNNNLIDVRNDIGDGYLEYFEKINSKIDFGCVYNTECEEYTRECNEHIPFGYSCADSVFEEIASLDENLAYFDWGCGKGASLLMAYMHGINNIGGVELIPQIYEQAKVNMNELHIECDIKNNDATTCNVDNYNCFFMYNPFVGNVFRKVIDNIEQSYINYPRNIYLVYGNPFEHKQVVKNGLFKMTKQIRTDLWDPLMNIYKIERQNNDSI